MGMLTNTKVVHHPHDHLRCINGALSKARKLCAERNARFTPIREAVLRLLWQSHQPLGAYQLQEQLSRISEKAVAAPTIYRTIDFLMELGLIHRIASLNAYIGCPFPGAEHSDLFLICNDCGTTAEVSHSHVNQLLQQASRRAGFTLRSQSLELFGLCPQCAIAEQQGSVSAVARQTRD